MSGREKALISVIIPVYNAEKYLKRCLDSVLNQTYKNLEIIIVDDGSTDDSGAICDKYSQSDGRIKVIHKTNAGAAEARNTGLEHATGEYISFVDSDDLVNTEIIEKLYSAIIENDCDISVCGYWPCFESEKIDLGKTSQKQTERILKGKDTLSLFGSKGTVASNSVWAKLFKTSLFENIRFPAFKTAEDLFVVFKLYSKANRIYVTDKQFYYYICRQGSLMHGKKLNTDDTVGVCNKLIEYCNDYIEDKDLKVSAMEKIAFVEANTVLDNYYLSVKRRLGKKEQNYHKKLYADAKKKYGENIPQSFKFKLFEKSTFLFYIAMLFFTKIYHKDVV